MRNARRTAAVAAAAGCLTVGGALGTGLLSAGAATSGSSTNSAPSTDGSGDAPHHGFGHHCHHHDGDAGTSGTDSTVQPDANVGV
jgi:hypothetical protein